MKTCPRRSRWVRALILTVAVAVVATSWLPSVAAAQSFSLGSGVVNGKRVYFTLETYGQRVEVWSRGAPNACSRGDRKVMELSIRPASLNEAKRQVCRVVAIYDKGKTVVGCGAVAGTAACYLGPNSVCLVSVRYGLLGGGYADCLRGLAGTIATRSVSERDWMVIETATRVTPMNLKEVVMQTIRAACTGVR